MNGPLAFPFRLGLDESADPKAQPPGTLAVAQNVRVDKTGRLRKRFGTELVPRDKAGGGTLAAGARLVTHGDDLGLIDGTDQFIRSSSTALWRDVDRVPSLDARWNVVTDTSSSVTDATVAVAGDLVFVAFLATSSYPGNLYVQAFERSTGARVMPPTLIYTGVYWPRLVVMADRVLVLFVAGTTIVSVEILLADLSVVVHGAFQNVTANAIFDAQNVGGVLVCAYEYAGNARITSYDATYAVTHDVALAARTGLVTIAIHGTPGERIYVAYGSSTTLKTYAAVVNPVSLSIWVAEAAIYNYCARSLGLIRYDATHGLLALNSSTPGALITVHLPGTGAMAVVPGTTRTTQNTLLMSQPWTQGGRFYALVTPAQAAYVGYTFQKCIAVMEIETADALGYTGRHAATLAPRIGAVNALGYATQVAISGDLALVVFPFLTSQQPQLTTLPKAAAIAEIALASTSNDMFRSVVMGPDVAVCAGAPFVLDGMTSPALGFLHEPWVVSATPSNAGGHMVTGTYLYAFGYEWRDANGITHRSPISAPISVTIPAGGTGIAGSVALVIGTATLSGKQDSATGFGANVLGPAEIVMYRSEKGGSILYRLSMGPLYNVVTNDPTAASVAWTDTRDDAAIDGTSLELSTRPQPYSASALDDLCPPGAVAMVVHQRRIALLAGDLRTVWFSQDMATNPSVAPGFNELLTLAFDHDKNALGSLDATLVVLGADTIDLVDGDGSPPNGIPFGWTSRRLQTDVGCVAPRSVVTGPPGLFFLSRRGLELLDRGLNVTWMGRRVQDELAAFPVITSAVLVASEHEIRWTCVSADGSSGITLVFDYANAFWSSRVYYDTVGAVAGVPFVDAALIGGVWTALCANGAVYRETAASFLDGGSQWVQLAVETTWISPAGPLSWHRVRQMELLGTALTPHDLQVEIARDFQATWEQNDTFAAGSDVTAPGPLESCRITHKVQKTQAVRYRIADATPTNPGANPVGTGEGPMLEGLGMIVQQKGGLPKRGATREK